MRARCCGIFVLVWVLLSSPNLIQAGDPVDRVNAITSQITPQIVEWRRDFHAHPELSNREERTSRVVAAILKQMGVDEIKTGIAHHGVVALIRGNRPGPTVGLRADMDALPITEDTDLPFACRKGGVMHACGHDAHTSMLLGAARVLTQLRDEIDGTVKLIFQPAEEGPPMGEEGGAKLMIAEGVLHDPDIAAMFALHVFPTLETGKLGYRFGGLLAAVDRFKIEVTGKQVHAALPWDGIDPVVASAHIVLGLQTIASRIVDTRQPVVVTVGVVNGGQRWNIIPETVTLEGTVRTHSKDVRARARRSFEQIVNKVAEAHGTKAEIVYEGLAPVVWNDPELGKRMLSTLRRSVGAENVVEVPPTMGGEDFAYFSQQVPGLYLILGIRNESIGAVKALHTPYFVLDEAALPIGARTLAMLALDFLKQNGK